MGLNLVDLWTSILWKHFRAQIFANEPLYFAVDQELIQTLGSSSDRPVTNQDINEEFRDACLSLLDLKKGSAEVLPATFSKISGKPFSRVICLAVHQVLVVETMLNDSSYSENSYFPRYREALGLIDSDRQSNPIRVGQFRQIWRTLEEEILAAPDASPSVISFSEGTGRDKYRNYPLSQALFTTHDLTIIKENNKQLTPLSNDGEILFELFSKRNTLGRRARRLVKTDENKQSLLCKQVRSFLSGTKHSSLISRHKVRSEKSQGQLVAFLDMEDFFDEAFSVYFQADHNQFEGDLLKNELEKQISSEGFILMVSEGSKYLPYSKSVPLQTGAALIVITPEGEAPPWLINACRGTSLFQSSRSNLPPTYELFSCDSYDGTLETQFRSNYNKSDKLTLVGGLQADERIPVFLAGYPPSWLTFNGHPLSGSAVIKIGGKDSTVEEFFNLLKDSKSLQTFDIQFGKQKVEFAISSGIPKKFSGDKFGYRLIASELELTPNLLTEKEDGLQGNSLMISTSEVTKDLKIKLSQADVLAMVYSRKKVSVTQKTAKILIKNLEVLSEPKNLIGFAIHQLQQTKSIGSNAITLRILNSIRGR